MEYKRLKFEECRDGVSNIRRKVFIEEQNCPEHMEWDEEEEKQSLYFVAFRGEVAVGCLRLRNVEQHLLKMERVAVLKEYRRRGIASELIREAMLYTQTEASDCVIYAYAQVSALQAYVSLGFTVLSKVWIEDGTFIPHQTIFWGTPVSIDQFLNYQSSKTDGSYEEYDVRSAVFLPKIESYKQRRENLDTWNFCALHTELNDKIVTKIVRKRFAKLCWQSEYLLNGNDCELSQIEEESHFLSKLADQKLNTGHFNEVDENWRKLYSMVNFVQSFILFKRGDLENALTIADKGLCMGRIDEEKVPLRQLAWHIHEQLPTTSSTIHPAFQDQPSENNGLKPLPNSKLIEECEEGDSFERLLEAILHQKPLLVRGLASGMPAVGKWTFPFLLEQLHSRTFPVEIGSKYSDEDWSQKMMTFHQFLANQENENVYLAQHRLFDQVPHLKRDIHIPDVCFSKSENAENVDMNMWIGPAGTVSPLHTDPRKNIFVQVHGKKVVRLVAPEDSEAVYPFDGMLSNTSQVDVEHPDYTQFPLFSSIRVLDGVLEAGDGLFVPIGWWHHVRATTPSVSVSFWFD